LGSPAHETPNNPALNRGTTALNRGTTALNREPSTALNRETTDQRHIRGPDPDPQLLDLGILGISQSRKARGLRVCV
jgi:hypothetical protein